MPDEQNLDDKPPYLSFTTLVNFFDRLGSGPIPPRIDKSALDTYSGGVQSILLATLRAMEFIDENGRVQESLREAATSEDARKAHLTRFARRVYATQLSLAQENATAQMLHESFADAGYQGSTMRKAVVFYLALVDYLGLPNSPLFRPPRQPATGTSGRRQRRAGRNGPLPPPPVSHPASEVAPRVGGQAAETRTVSIAGDGTVTLIVEARWLDMPLDTVTKLRQIVADLEDLGTPGDESGDDAA